MNKLVTRAAVPGGIALLAIGAGTAALAVALFGLAGTAANVLAEALLIVIFTLGVGWVRSRVLRASKLKRAQHLRGLLDSYVLFLQSDSESFARLAAIDVSEGTARPSSLDHLGHMSWNSGVFDKAGEFARQLTTVFGAADISKLLEELAPDREFYTSVVEAARLARDALEGDDPVESHGLLTLLRPERQLFDRQALNEACARLRPRAREFADRVAEFQQAIHQEFDPRRLAQGAAPDPWPTWLTRTGFAVGIAAAVIIIAAWIKPDTFVPGFLGDILANLTSGFATFIAGLGVALLSARSLTKRSESRVAMQVMKTLVSVRRIFDLRDTPPGEAKRAALAAVSQDVFETNRLLQHVLLDADTNSASLALVQVVERVIMTDDPGAIGTWKLSNGQELPVPTPLGSELTQRAVDLQGQILSVYRI